MDLLTDVILPAKNYEGAGSPLTRAGREEDGGGDWRASRNNLDYA
jgi:hypothetical protein